MSYSAARSAHPAPCNPRSAPQGLIICLFWNFIGGSALLISDGSQVCFGGLLRQLCQLLSQSHRAGCREYAFEAGDPLYWWLRLLHPPPCKCIARAGP